MLPRGTVRRDRFDFVDVVRSWLSWYCMLLTTLSRLFGKSMDGHSIAVASPTRSPVEPMSTQAAHHGVSRDTSMSCLSSSGANTLISFVSRRGNRIFDAGLVGMYSISTA